MFLKDAGVNLHQRKFLTSFKGEIRTLNIILRCCSSGVKFHEKLQQHKYLNQEL